MDLLASQVSSTDRLKVDDNICYFQVSLFLQVCQNSSAEEDLTLTDPVEVWV